MNNFQMRNQQQIEKIKNHFSSPRLIENFISREEIEHLISIFENSKDTTDFYKGKIHKNTGPITLNLEDYFEDPVVSKIIKNIELHIGPFSITASFIFKTDYPHIIHNDDTFELPDTVYKAITIPLFLENFKGTYPKLCFFDQFYFHGPAKFFKGSSNIPTYYNKQVYDYSDVENSVEHEFIDTNGYFTHLKSQWLSGLSLNSAIDWIPGSAIIFDSVRLHCASDFRNLGITSKLGISIFTKK
jgi:hypothetical protein